jgi:methylglutaconyl-CoA hydratase
LKNLLNLKLEHLKNYSVVLLNRPHVKNAFDPEMIAELTAVFKFLSTRKETNFILLRGLGTAFCAGADLGWMKKMIDYTKAENKKDSEKMWTMFETIKNCPKPVIAQVHGAVFGGALGLVACADIVAAEETTKFCFSEVKLGLAPAVISSFILRKVSLAHASSVMISGEVFEADQAITMGLVHKKFQNSITDDELLKPLLQASPSAMTATKKMLLSLSNDSKWLQKKKMTTTLISSLRVSEDAQVRLKKFLEKK